MDSVAVLTFIMDADIVTAQLSSPRLSVPNGRDVGWQHFLTRQRFALLENGTKVCVRVFLHSGTIVPGPEILTVRQAQVIQRPQGYAGHGRAEAHLQRRG